jgi:hypothetical protein
MTNNITLFNLLMFNTTELNEIEQELFNFDKPTIQKILSKLDKGTFYLGGQLKMKHNDIINLDSIQEVREIDRKRYIEYGGPCNSFEAASIYESNRELEFIENMIVKYNQIMKIRENRNLNESNLYYNI